MAKAQNRVEFTYISPSLLRFDPRNPRFGGTADGKSQEEIQQFLEFSPHYALDLVDSFLVNGYIDYEPLVVKRHGNRFIVVEGNRRLAAIRHILNNKEKYQDQTERMEDLERIPVLVFPEEKGSQETQEQRVFLGVRHLFGFRDWPPESKAKFLDSNIQTKDDLSRILRELNIKKVEVRRYLIPFRLRRAAVTLWKPYRTEEFWVLGEGLNRSGIKEYIELDVDADSLAINGFNRAKLKNLLQFVYGMKNRKIRETRDLSKLASVLKSKRAAKVLEAGGSLDEAVLLVESPQEKLKSLKRLVSELKVVLKGVPSRTRKRATFKVLLEQLAALEKAANAFIRDAQKPGV